MGTGLPRVCRILNDLRDNFCLHMQSLGRKEQIR